MADDRIGSYKILQKMGAGGMAKVFLAVHEDVPNLKVVLKILDDPQLGERFIQEADKLALLDGHPSVCRIKHFFRHGERTIIAMEYIDGETLDQRLKTEGRLGFDEATRIAAEVLDTLQFAHAKGIFHRDIKPGNIMIDRAGRVKVIDFGIAKARTDPDLTRSGTCCGTPAYMAPEQFTPMPTTDYARADIYAVGTTLFKMLTGELPFKGDNEFAIRDAKLFSEPPRPSSLRKDMPKHLEAAVLKAISKDPDGRFQTALEMRQTLLRVAPSMADHRESAEVTAAVGTAAPATRPRAKRRHPLAVVLGVIIVAAIAALAVWLLQQPKTVSPAAPQLYTPNDEMLIDNTDRPRFTWSGSAGPNGRYTLEIAPDSQFTDPQRLSGLADTVYFPSTGMSPGDYWWRVSAVAADGIVGPVSKTRGFTIETSRLQGTLAISVNRPSEIYVNDERVEVGASEYRSQVDTGTYQVRVVNDRSNEKALQGELRVLADHVASRSFRFTFTEAPPETPSAPPSPAAGRAKLAVLSIPPGAAIFIDGQPQRDVYTPHTLTLAVGSHRVKAILVGDEEKTVETVVEVRAGSENRVMFDFERDSALIDF